MNLRSIHSGCYVSQLLQWNLSWSFLFKKKNGIAIFTDINRNKTNNAAHRCCESGSVSGWRVSSDLSGALHQWRCARLLRPLPNHPESVFPPVEMCCYARGYVLGISASFSRVDMKNPNGVSGSQIPLLRGTRGTNGWCSYTSFVAIREIR